MSDSTASQHRLSKRVERELHQTKVVIRRLPPDCTEEKFKEKIAPLPPHNYFYFVPGDPALGPYGYSRAYINFTDESQIVPFRDQVDGLAFETERAQKYCAVVEFAPSQAIPRKVKRKKDVRCGTIEQDADYLTFLEAYNAETKPADSIDFTTYIEELETNRVPDVMVTPLIEYLKVRKDKRKASKAKVYVIEKKKKKGDSTGKPKPSKGGGSKGMAGERDEGSYSKGSSRSQKQQRGSKEGKSVTPTPADKSGSSVKLVKQEQEDQTSSRSSMERDSTRPHSRKGGGWKESEQAKGSYSESWKGSSSRRDQDSLDSKRSSSPYSVDRKASCSSERGGAEGGGGAGGSGRGRGRSRNKDKPDRPIYVPKSRDSDSGAKAYSKDSSQSRESGDHYRPKKDYSSSGRYDESYGKTKDRGHYYGDEYGRRDRERRGGELDGGEKEWGSKPRGRGGGRGGRGRGGGGGGRGGGVGRGRGRGWGKDRDS